MSIKLLRPEKEWPKLSPVTNILSVYEGPQWSQDVIEADITRSGESSKLK